MSAALSTAYRLQCGFEAYVSFCAQATGVDLRQAAWFSALPWAVMAAASIVAGRVADSLASNGLDTTRLRKLMQVGSRAVMCSRPTLCLYPPLFSRHPLSVCLGSCPLSIWTPFSVRLARNLSACDILLHQVGDWWLLALLLVAAEHRIHGPWGVAALPNLHQRRQRRCLPPGSRSGHKLLQPGWVSAQLPGERQGRQESRWPM